VAHEWKVENMIYVYVCRNCDERLETFARLDGLKCNLCGQLLDRDYRAESANVNVESLRQR
jgi:transcription elongation factor Elf1